MAPLSRSPERIASVRIPSESLGALAQPSAPGRAARPLQHLATPGGWPGRGRLREAPGWQTRAACDPRADPRPGKPTTTRWSASAPRDRESRPSSGPIMSQGGTSAGTTSYGRGQRGARRRRCWTEPAASAPGPLGTNLRRVLSELGSSFRRQLRHCLAYLKRRMPLRTSPGRPGPTGDPRWGLQQMRAALSGRDAAWVTYSRVRGWPSAGRPASACTHLTPGGKDEHPDRR